MGCGASTSNAYAAPPPEAATEQRAPEPSAAIAPPEPEPEPEPQPPAPAPAPATDVGATKAKTRGALLGGLKSGALEAAVAKMEEDTAAEEEPATAPAPAPAQAPAPATDVGATKAKTRGALLGGLKSGALEAAVAKMEEDTAAEEEPAPAPAPAPATDVGATKAKTRGALLGGLKSGALEAAVAKMEEDTALEEETAADAGPVRRHARITPIHTHTHPSCRTHTSAVCRAILTDFLGRATMTRWQSPTPRSKLASDIGDELTEEVRCHSFLCRRRRLPYLPMKSDRAREQSKHRSMQTVSDRDKTNTHLPARSTTRC
jgi:hypothetical protein